MARLFALKGRDAAKSIAVLVGDLGQAREPDHPRPRPFRAVLAGPLTVVVPAAAGAVLYIGDDDTTVGIRCPDDAFVRRLALEVGPIAASSANESGAPTPATAREIAATVPVGRDRRRRRSSPRRGVDGHRRDRGPRSCCGRARCPPPPSGSDLLRDSR